ncbi:FAD/NAD(P)-binding domain-containing protein [Artemisia annua]|uniref:FAD/NAD(P)-binding domain-containing protein n=1 Tax=Artemisia annua TaxID=35608 RepID=A0A2U1PGD1_ARTAN|nr:FAD/NAD(P)-binding domain-containing protein [Artemisia annua]
MDDGSSQQQPPKRVVVCGGGIIGVCTAYYLAKKGAIVTLIERSSIAGAASGKAGAFLALHMCDDGPLSSLARASFNLHRSLAEELNGSLSYGYCPLTTLKVTVDESKPASESHILPPWVDGGVKSEEIIGTTDTTAQIHPQLFTRALLAKAVEEYGVEVVMEKVESVAVEGDGVVVMVDGYGAIRGDAVVLALGPWTSKLTEVSSKFKVIGKKVHSIVLEPKDGDMITPHGIFATYYPGQGMGPIDPDFFPRPTSDVYICGPSVEVEVPDEPDLVFPDEESIQVLKRVAGIVSSYLKEENVKVQSEQAGLMPCTDDELPIMGEIPGMKHCYVASGHGYWGILFGPASGVAMAELVLDGHASIVDLGPFSPTRFVGTKI